MNKLVFIALFSLFTSAAVVTLSACKGSPPEPEPIEEEPLFTLKTELVNQGEVVEIDDVFTDVSGNKVKLVALKFYLADIELIDDDGKKKPISSIELFDHKPVDESISTPQWSDEYSYTIPQGNYASISFGLGVPEDLNGIDPATYDNDEALSIYSNMYWSWASMYRFVILEAKMDTSGNGVFDHDVIFHTGLDELYRPEIERTSMFSATLNSESELTLRLDWNKLFYSGEEEIDILTENATHTTDNPEDLDLAVRFTTNFTQALSVQ
ncbi:MAG: hypothetical protein RLP15_01910 [Cryomorphaceae bacterium]